MTYVRRPVPLGLLVAVHAFAPAAAQEVLDPVVVTATRAEEPSLRIPASVDRIYADEIEFARPQVNISETLNRLPGVVASNRQNYALAFVQQGSRWRLSEFVRVDNVLDKQYVGSV